MTRGKTLQDRLANSLDAANKRDSKAHRQTQAPALATAPAILAADRKCTKLSVSLFDGDMKRLDAIVAYMAERGERLSTSQAIKLALRTAPLSEALKTALDQVKAEDGRGKW